MTSVLVVDDEQSTREIVKSFLEMEGHEVMVAEDAELAMAIFQSRPFDVVLIDIVLPKVSGVELLRQIRDRSPEALVVMMTGQPTLDTASESLRLGAMDYLQKPFDKDKLAKVVLNAANIKKLRDDKKRLEDENRKYMTHLEQLVEERTRALALSEKTVRHRAGQLTILNRLIGKVNESVTVDEIFRYGLGEIVDCVKPDLAVFFQQLDEKLVLKAQFPEDPPAPWRPAELHRIGACLCALAIKEDQAVYSAHIGSDSRCTLEECRDSGFHSFAALPLKSGSEVIGGLGMASLEERDFRDQRAILEALVNEMAIGLKNSLLYEQVQRHAAELKESLCRIEEAEAVHRKLEEHLQRSQKMEAIWTLASGIAHDFNNILGGVIGYTELAVLDTPEESKAKKNLNMVMTSAMRAKELVDQILNFSRQSEEERKPVIIGQAIDELIQFIRASLPATITIVHDSEASDETIMADPVQIQQVLINLCTNAHHAMKDTGGELKIRSTKVDLLDEQETIDLDLQPGPYVKICVKDTGKGMDANTMLKIFDPYYTTKAKGVGTGLGLAMVHSIVKRYGGAIAVQSDPGVGTCFDVYFPVIQKEIRVESPVDQHTPRGNERILLVDDEQVLVDMGVAILEHLGYAVETRTSSVDALALFKAQPNRFDLVITDMTMPDLTGDRLATEMLGVREDLPILLCTGYCDDDMQERARKIGIKGMVMKPIRMANLATAVREALQ